MLQKLREESLNGRRHCSVLLDVAPGFREVSIMIFYKSSSKEAFDTEAQAGTEGKRHVGELPKEAAEGGRGQGQRGLAETAETGDPQEPVPWSHPRIGAAWPPAVQ